MQSNGFSEDDATDEDSSKTLVVSLDLVIKNAGSQTPDSSWELGPSS